MSSSVAPSNSKGEYAKLKKDLLFHEKRMQLLLGSRIVEDISHNLKEKAESRVSCEKDCVGALKAFESGATELHLTGKWSEVRITSMFGLEVPLSTVVGSDKFETPLSGIAHVGELLTQMQLMAQKIPEFRTDAKPTTTTTASSSEGDQDQQSGTTTNNSNNNKSKAAVALMDTANQALVDVNAFIQRATGIHWTPSDLRRITEAIASKHTVLKELESLAAALRDAQYSASREQVHLEQLRRADEIATNEGEIATEEAVVRERLEALERLIDILFFEAHTVDSSIDSNVKKRRSNMSVFVNGAAVVQCIAREKEEIIRACESDIKKIDRCVLYEEAHNGHGDIRNRIAKSAGAIKSLSDKQTALQQRLVEIHKEWVDTEQALENLGQQRAKAITEHVELLDSSRHAQSDFLEMCKYAEQYKRNLDVTSEESRRAIDQLHLLEKILLQQQTFESYDFQASARRLVTMQRRVAFDMNRALNEHQKCAEQLLRRLDGQSRAISEAIDVNECEAEIRRDTLDPTTKRYVEKARELARQREVIENESRKLAERVIAERDQCLSKIREVLPEEDVVDDAERINEEMMTRHEELLDMRQELVTPPEMAILDERLRVAREKQSTLAAVLQDTTRRSRILAIRNDIGRQRGADESSALAAPSTGEDGGDEDNTTTNNKKRHFAAGGSNAQPPAVVGYTHHSPLQQTTTNDSNTNTSPASTLTLMVGQKSYSPSGAPSALVAASSGVVLEGGVRGAIAAAANAAAASAAAVAAANTSVSATSLAEGRLAPRNARTTVGSSAGAGGSNALPINLEDISAVIGDDERGNSNVGIKRNDVHSANNNNAAGVKGGAPEYQHLYGSSSKDSTADRKALPQTNTTTPPPSSSPHPPTNNPFEFNPNPDKLTTSAALRAEAAAEEKLVEAERLARLHGHKVDIFALGKAKKSGLLFGSSGSNVTGGGNESNNTNTAAATAADGMHPLDAESEAERRALVMAYRSNEERTLRMRDKPRSIGDL